MQNKQATLLFKRWKAAVVHKLTTGGGEVIFVMIKENVM